MMMRSIVRSTSLCGILLLATTQVQANDQPTSEKARFKLVEGKGYTVCEAYLKNLNALPKNEPPPVCELNLPAKDKRFSQPEWELLDWREHLDWVYLIEKALPPTSEVKPPFEEWKHEYLMRVEKDKLSPRLRRTRLALNSRGIETLFAYDRNVNACPTALRNNWSSLGGSNHLIHIDGKQPLFKVIDGDGGTSLVTHLFVFQKRPYFMLVGQGGFPWDASITTVAPPLPPNLREEPGDYVSQFGFKCRYLLKK